MTKILWSIFFIHCCLIAFWIVYFYNAGINLLNSSPPITNNTQYWLSVLKSIGGGAGVSSSLVLSLDTLTRVTVSSEGCCSKFLYAIGNLLSFLSHFLGIVTWIISFIIDNCSVIPPKQYVPSILCSTQHTYLNIMIFIGVFAEILLGICLLRLFRLLPNHRYQSL